MEKRGQRRGLRRFSLFAALAFLLLASASFAVTGAFAQDDVVVPINELNGSGVSGDASLTDNGDGTTTVDILVDGATGMNPRYEVFLGGGSGLVFASVCGLLLVINNEQPCKLDNGAARVLRLVE